MQAANHRDRESALSVQDLGDPGARADDVFQVSSRKALLLHAELDGLDRVGRIHRIMLGLVRIDEGRKHIQPIALRSAGPLAPKALDFFERRLVVALRADRFYL